MFDHFVYTIICTGIFFVLSVAFFIAVLVGNRVWWWI